MTRSGNEISARFDRVRLLDLLPSLDEEELSDIARLLGPVSSNALAWCESQGLAHRNVVLPVAIVNIVQSPSLRVNELAVLSEMALWVAEIDELFDTSDESESSLTMQVEEALGIASDLDLESVSDRGRALSDLVRALTDSPLWPMLQPIWTATLAQVFAGWMFERSLQEGLRTNRWKPVSVDGYLSFAQHTTALRWLWLSSVILENPAAMLRDISSFLTFAGQCARVFRLADDLATRHRESNTGDINSVLIEAHLLLEGDAGLTKERASAVAVALVQERLRKEREKAQGLLTSVVHRDLARRLFRGLELGVEIYAKSEMRKWASLGTELTLAPVPSTTPPL
jgi:hypothetical protein